MRCFWLANSVITGLGQQGTHAIRQLSSQLVLRLWVPINIENVSQTLDLRPELESVYISKNYSLLTPVLEYNGCVG